jgi:hypothetical protein
MPLQPLRAIELPARWIAFLRPAIQSIGGLHTLDVATLPTALAFGAPARLTAILEVDSSRARFAVTGAILEGRPRSLVEVEDRAWGPFWLGSLVEAMDGEVRRRGATRPGVPRVLAVPTIRPPWSRADER